MLNGSCDSFQIYVMAESLSSDNCGVEDPKLGTSVESQQDHGTTTTADSSDIKCMEVEYPKPSTDSSQIV